MVFQKPMIKASSISISQADEIVRIMLRSVYSKMRQHEFGPSSSYSDGGWSGASEFHPKWFMISLAPENAAENAWHLFREDPFQSSSDFRRLVDDFCGERLQLIAGDRLSFPASLLHFIEHLRIFEHPHESVAENFQALRRHVRGRHDRPRAKAPDAQVGIDQSALGLVHFILVHELENRRHVRQLVVTFLFGLENHADEAFFEPTLKRFPAEKSVDGDGATLNFIALHRESCRDAAGQPPRLFTSVQPGRGSFKQGLGPDWS